ncbi:MAG: TIGR02678 family protein [Clostridia bacterium]|nr:TIGR02678 family protein [Clostridia bacterium]
MYEIQELLSRRWILRKQDPELYYKLKDQYHKYSEFIKQKLGYNIIVNPLLIKIEKIPGKPQSFMGIQEFEDPKSYVFLCIVLMYLEELDQGEQFILSFVLEYVRHNYPSQEVLEWTNYDNRMQMIRVLKFCIQEGLILINDGDFMGFRSSEDAVEVLYENTGASKYFMRRFPFDISEIKSIEDFSEKEWHNTDQDSGLIRRHRIYRRLFMEPIVYSEGKEDQDYLYIKNYNSYIRNDISKYLNSDFHLHQNGALIMMPEIYKGGFPNGRNISDMVIQLCTLIIEESFERDSLDRIHLDPSVWERLIKNLKERFSSGWNKENREMVLSKLSQKLKFYMTYLNMIEVKEDEITLLPLVGKFKGDYPKTYWEQKNG